MRVAGNLPYRTASGIWSAARRLKNRVSNLVDPPVLVLIYHRVASPVVDREQLAVSPENFRSHLAFLKETFPVVRFEDDWSHIREPSVVVTFDDGYADNAKEALPILAEVEIPATFFVSSGAIDTRREFWWDELERIILNANGPCGPFELRDARYGGAWETDTPDQRELLFRDLHSLIPLVRAKRREEWLAQLRAWGGCNSVGREANRSLTSVEVKALAASPWATVGAHTVTHTPLAILSEEEQRQEILASRETLEHLTGRKITVFSYPFGRKADYNRTSVRICREAGFLKVAANFPGQAHRWTDPFQIPRQLVRDWDGETFALKMRSFWT